MNDAGIYIIQRKDSDECYIGSAVDLANRWRLHRAALKNGKHRSSRLQRVHNKHGAAVLEFAILETVADKARLIEREQAWLDRFNPAYNTATVAGSLLGFKHSAESLARMSVAQKARPPRSAETRAKLSAALRARPPISDETRRRLSFALKARAPFSAEHRANMSAAWKSRPPFSAEHRANLAAARKRRPPCSAETRERLSAAGKVRLPHSAETRQRQSLAAKAQHARERLCRSAAE